MTEVATPTATPDTPEVTQEKGQYNPFVHALLLDAQSLKDEKDALFERIDDNRQTLRTVKRTGFLSNEQAEAIDKWYPMPKRHKKDDQDDAQEGQEAQAEAQEEQDTGDTGEAPEAPQEGQEAPQTTGRRRRS
jgi:hypothetical protein